MFGVYYLDNLENLFEEQKTRIVCFGAVELILTFLITGTSAAAK